MNKLLREEMEYLIKCNDKAITPDVKDDVKMTLDYIDKLEEENKLLKEKLDVAETNEETFRLEMQETTKILWLDEHTIYDDVKLKIENIIKEKREQKKRIDKAIEYIEKHKEPLHHSFDEPDCDYWIATNPDDLLDILRGKDNE